MKNRLLLVTLTGTLLTAFTTSAQTNFFSQSGDLAFLDTGGTPPDSGVEEVDGSGTIGSGTALRIWDLDTTDKGEVYMNLSSPITTGFIISYDAYNITTTGSSANRLRFGNAGVSLGTEANTISSISHETDGDLTYKYDDGAGGRSTDKVTPGLDTLHSVTVVFNVSASPLVYDLGSGSQSVAAYSFAFYVDDMTTAVASDLPLHLTASTGYDTSLGVGKIGWTGSSDSSSGIDLLVDNVTVTTIVPEPSTFAFLFGAFSLGLCFLRRRK